MSSDTDTDPDTDADDDTLDPLDLLTDDGEIDESAVARRATSGKRSQPTNTVSATECSELRERAIDERALRNASADTERSHETVYEHVTGRCRHDREETEIPPLVYDESVEVESRGRGVWKRPEDVNSDGGGGP